MSEPRQPLPDSSAAPDTVPTQEISDSGTGDSGLQTDNGAQTDSGDAMPPRKTRRHFIRPRWLRRTLRTLLGLLIFILLLPVLVYIPPVQSLLKNIACSEASKATGMKIAIDRFRLRFPLDVSLDGVLVVEASGDTMVRARSVEVDVKMLPLLRLDVQVQKLRLLDGYYRMLSADSSMTLTVGAPYLEASPGASFNVAESRLSLDVVTLRGGRLNLVMNPWKSKPTPPQPGTFVIRANRLRLEDFTFGMRMLPTIDTLSLHSAAIDVEGGLVNLRDNLIEVRRAVLANGSATYIAPTAEYVASHPAPPPSPYPSAPMVVKVGDISLQGFDALYTTAGTRPLPGFDPAYIQVSGLNLRLADFYNEQSTVRLPITAVSARERSGLRIVEGTGTVDIDSTGIALRQLKVSTSGSRIEADATLSMGMMAMEPQAPFSVRATARLGMADLKALVPAASSYIDQVSAYGPLKADVDAAGSLAAISLPRLALELPGVVSLTASGRVANAMKPERLEGNLDFNGRLLNPTPVQRLAGLQGLSLPALDIKGTASARGTDYAARFSLISGAGDVKADGRVGLRSERYYADVDVRNLDVGRFMPGMGVGAVSGRVLAEGAGFNPLLPRASADVSLDISRVIYNKVPLSDITATATLHGGAFDVRLNSANQALDGRVEVSGTIEGDVYTVDMSADIARFDLRALGLSTDTLEGSGSLTVNGVLNPSRMLGDVYLSSYDLDVLFGGHEICIPGGMQARVLSAADSVGINVSSDRLTLDFSSPQPLRALIPAFEKGSAAVMRQVTVEKSLAVDEFQPLLPKFDLVLRASGGGVLGQALAMAGLKADSLYADISNHDIITADALLMGLNTGTMTLDTLTLAMSERGRLLDYRLHLGNAPGTLDEFANVNLSGYVGEQRASAYLHQRNLKGETGYRLGLTAAFTDTLINVHFTPLRATIAYLPWVFNVDNMIGYDMKERIEANLVASSNESSISIVTKPRPGKELPVLDVNLTNIRLQDFTSMIIGAPDIAGVLNTSMQLVYENRAFEGDGSLSLAGLTYNGQRVADLSAAFNAGVDFNGNTSAHASLDVDGREALTFQGVLRPDTAAMRPGDMSVSLTDFPVSIANAFLGPDVASLSGTLSGSMEMTGRLSAPVLNGSVRCDGVKVFLPIMGGTLTLDTVPLTVKDNYVEFNDFDIWGANSNPLTIRGHVDARKLTDITLDMSLHASDFMLINNTRRGGSSLYGKILLNADATARGRLDLLDIEGSVSVLQGTDAYYTLSPMQQMAQQSNADVVKFVEFSDTAAIAAADSLRASSSMRILATLNISNGVQVTINLSDKSSDKVQLSPSGRLSYFQNYMGDMKLNGTVNLGAGRVSYAVPALGEKRFAISPESYVVWNGDILDPTLHVMASDMVKSVAQTGGNSSRVINFLVSVSATGTLQSPNVLFDLSTDDDVTIQNELQSMSADQRSSEAMNMILYGRYMGPGAASSGGTSTMLNNALYGFLESQINNWAANNIRGVDLTFGIDQFATSQDGRSQTSTSYSYQVSKSLFNNKFKIIVGGNYSTDQNSDDNIAENLISNISFEYMLRQTNTMSVYAKLFRHSDYESVLEGEITEMGAGIVMQRKLSHLRQLFSWLRRHRRRHRQREAESGAAAYPASPATESAAPAAPPASHNPTDTVPR